MAQTDSGKNAERLGCLRPAAQAQPLTRAARPGAMLIVCQAARDTAIYCGSLSSRSFRSLSIGVFTDLSLASRVASPLFSFLLGSGVAVSRSRKWRALSYACCASCIRRSLSCSTFVVEAKVQEGQRGMYIRNQQFNARVVRVRNVLRNRTWVHNSIWIRCGNSRVPASARDMGKLIRVQMCSSH